MLNVTFIGSLPTQQAAARHRQVLDFGKDELRIACAFATGAGVELLRDHERRLRAERSFIVVADEKPTTRTVVDQLAALAPGNVYLHLGFRTPKEKSHVRGLMHAKMFLARSGERFQLWSGSHNLTGSAMLGVNYEAGVLLEGQTDDPVYRDAVSFLEQCRDESERYDPLAPPPQQPSEPTLIIHAERHVAVPQASAWQFYLRVPTPELDRATTTRKPVWVFLYEPGSLRPGVIRPAAVQAFSGHFTGQNQRDNHPGRGASATWDVSRTINIMGLVPRLELEPAQQDGTSEAVAVLDKIENPLTVWSSKNPSPKEQKNVVETRESTLDQQFREFFTKDSFDRHGHLRHQRYGNPFLAAKLSRKELGAADDPRLQFEEEGGNLVRYLVADDVRLNDASPFIYEAKFRLLG